MMKQTHEIPDVLYRIAAASVVMSGHEWASSGMSGHHYERTRIMLRKDIKEFLESEGLDVSVVVNRLLENFIIAYRAFWNSYEKEVMLRPGFEPGSRNRESRMIGRATPPEPVPDIPEWG